MENNKNSIKSNYIFNLSYQLLALIVPIFTAPYLSRVLTINGVGINSYAQSMVTYFTVFAILGSGTFASRHIGICQDNIEERSQVFYNILSFRMITSAICLLIYAIYIVFTNSDNANIYWIYALNVINVAIDISWFFQGMEEFKKITVRNIIVKVLNLIFVFTFVKNEKDLWIYVLGFCTFTILGSLSMWIYISQYVQKVKKVQPFKYFKQMFLLLIPTLAIQVFTVLDKSMIGWITKNSAENGAYDRSEMIVRMCLTLISSLSLVMIPRVARLYAQGNKEEVNRYIYKSFRFTWFMSMPIVLGLCAVSDIFVPVFLGKGYESVTILLPIMSLLCIACGISNVLGTQYLIPTQQQNYYTVAVISAAAVNLCMNLILIQKYAALGAVISSVLAEFLEAIILFLCIIKKKQFSVKKSISSCGWYLLAAVVMYFGVCFVKKAIGTYSWANLLLSIATGGLIYSIVLIVVRDPMMNMVIEFLHKIVKKVVNR